MNEELFALEDIQIAKPCKARWERMTGDDRTRHCGTCKLNVYNVAGMTREETVNLIRTSEGRVCLRIYKRYDGTLLTKDCPAGVASARRKQIGLAAAAMVLLGFAVKSRALLPQSPQSGGVPSFNVARAQAWESVKHNLVDRPKDFCAHKFGITSWCTCPRFIMGY